MQDAGLQAVDIDDVVARVKYAIRAANLSTHVSPGDVVVREMVLILKIVQDLEAGAEARWKVPIINLELGGHANKKWSVANTVELTLVPPPPVAASAHGLTLVWTSSW